MLRLLCAPCRPPCLCCRYHTISKLVGSLAPSSCHTTSPQPDQSHGDGAGLYEVEVHIVDDDTGRTAGTTTHPVVAPPTAGEQIEAIIDDFAHLP